jgi:hypothetical protein
MSGQSKYVYGWSIQHYTHNTTPMYRLKKSYLF